MVWPQDEIQPTLDGVLCGFFHACERMPSLKGVRSVNTLTPEIHLAPTDLAQRWNVSVAHLANLRWESRGCAYLKIGASVRYRLSDVLAYEAASVVLAVA